jgi:uncharacterized protein GlcG (DUF336 family)
MNAPIDQDTSRLTLTLADTIATTALATGRDANLQPLTVVVLDAGGHLVCAKREDGSGILRFEIAFGKAWGALGMGRASRELEQVSLQRPGFMTALAAVSAGRLVPVAGGVLVRNARAEVIGAVGVSGDTSDADERCAIAGILAVGLASIPPCPPAAPRYLWYMRIAACCSRPAAGPT